MRIPCRLTCASVDRGSGGSRDLSGEIATINRKKLHASPSYLGAKSERIRVAEAMERLQYGGIPQAFVLVDVR